jgi:photosystem II stability/assembly factor-like uncharacterized protein
MNGGEPVVPPRRKRRAVAWGGVAVVVTIAAGVVYLRPATPASPPATRQVVVNPTETNIDFVTYDFSSPLVAWALHHPQSGLNDGPFWVSRTVDGGRHWQVRLRGDHGSYGGFFIPSSMRFFDKEHGFVVVMASPPVLYRTSDGGGHWTNLSFPVPQVGEAIFTDLSHGWIVVHYDRSPKVNLYSTEDGGETWRRLPDPPDSTGSLVARRPTEMWLTSGMGPSRVYRSVDGGLTWQPRDLPRPPESRELLGAPWRTSITLLPRTGVIASAECDCHPSGPLHFTSFDGGSTWRSFEFPSSMRPVIAAFQDDSHWWMIDVGTLNRTSDAGQTWTKVSAQLLDWDFAPRAVDMTHAWARISVTGGYGLATTNDAGVHWTRVTIPRSA